MRFYRILVTVPLVYKRVRAIYTVMEIEQACTNLWNPICALLEIEQACTNF